MGWIGSTFSPSQASAQEAVPVHREARHRLVLDSTRFRLLDVRIPAGDTTDFHVHDQAILYISINVSPTIGQVVGGEWPAGPIPPVAATPGFIWMDSSYVLQPLTHRVTNLGEGLFRLLAITSAGPVPATGPGGGSPLPGTVEVQSTWFRQSRIELGAQSSVEWSTRERPVLVAQPVAAPLVVTCTGRAPARLEGPGGWILVPPGSACRLVNQGADPVTAIAVEIR